MSPIFLIFLPDWSIAPKKLCVSMKKKILVTTVFDLQRREKGSAVTDSTYQILRARKTDKRLSSFAAKNTALLETGGFRLWKECACFCLQIEE